jgi:hypothetical protein
LQEQMELAMLFRKIATVVIDAPTFTTIDELRWAGPRDDFAEVAARIDAPRLVERAAKLTQTRN